MSRTLSGSCKDFQTFYLVAQISSCLQGYSIYSLNCQSDYLRIGCRCAVYTLMFEDQYHSTEGDLKGRIFLKGLNLISNFAATVKCGHSFACAVYDLKLSGVWNHLGSYSITHYKLPLHLFASTKLYSKCIVGVNLQM